ncbi:MAG: helicase-related protein, partial [Myxococcota bacterium]
GAGKTTRVPPALLDRLPGKILVLEPRRIAARASAERVAAELGEALGERVGYRVRFESKPGRRLDYVTEGVFLRMLQSDALAEVSAVVFDEFHERHLDGDLSLALVESLSRTRKDLHLLVMSATLDAEPIAKHLDAPRVRSEGQSYPVDIQYSQGRDERRLEARVASGIRALWHHPGDVLVFLPGVGEIERCREALKGVDAELLTLHGQLSAKDQRRVFAPSDRRRVVLATNVAETSITVDGITAVIDTGLARIPRWDASSGLARLSLTPISRASAIQRAGRAGRTAPGVCLRLYPRSDFDARDAHTPAEILRADATPLLLAVYRSGYRIDELNWLTPPPSASVDAARSTLERLGAIEEERLTSRGEQLARLPLHPRLGALLLDAAEHGARNDGALAAALVSERDFVPRGPAEAVGESDLEWRIELLRRRQPPARVHRPTLYRVREVARQLERLATDGERASADPLRRAVFRAFSDRLAKRMGESEGRIQVLLSAGGRAELAENSVVRDSEWMVALGTEMRGPRGREKTTVTLASAVEREWIEEELAGEIRAVEDLKLESGRVMQTEGFKLGELWLDRDHRPAPPG